MSKRNRVSSSCSSVRLFSRSDRDIVQGPPGVRTTSSTIEGVSPATSISWASICNLEMVFETFCGVVFSVGVTTTLAEASYTGGCKRLTPTAMLTERSGSRMTSHSHSRTALALAATGRSSSSSAGARTQPCCSTRHSQHLRGGGTLMPANRLLCRQRGL